MSQTFPEVGGIRIIFYYFPHFVDYKKGWELSNLQKGLEHQTSCAYSMPLSSEYLIHESCNKFYDLITGMQLLNSIFLYSPSHRLVFILGGI